MIAIDFEDPQRLEEAYLNEFSEGGFFVEDVLWDLETKVWLELAVGGPRVTRLAGQVAWRRLKGGGDRRLLLVGSGVRLLASNPLTRQQLRELACRLVAPAAARAHSAAERPWSRR